MKLFLRRVGFVILLLLGLTGCQTYVEVKHYNTPPPGYLSDGEKRQIAIRHYGHRVDLTRQEIVGRRDRTAERLLLRHYRSTPRDVMCFRHNVTDDVSVSVCSTDRQLSWLLRQQHRGYYQAVTLRLAPPHLLRSTPTYTSFSLGGNYHPRRY